MLKAQWSSDHVVCYVFASDLFRSTGSTGRSQKQAQRVNYLITILANENESLFIAIYLSCGNLRREKVRKNAPDSI